MKRLQISKKRDPWNKGKTGVYSKKTLRQMSLTKIETYRSGKRLPFCPDYKGRKNPMYGKNHSEATRQKIRLKALRRFKNPEAREELSIKRILYINRQARRQAKTRLKRSEAAKQMWARRKKSEPFIL